MYNLYFDRNFRKVKYIKKTFLSLEKYLSKNKKNSIQKNNNILIKNTNKISISWGIYNIFKQNTKFRLYIKEKYDIYIFFESGFINIDEYVSINVNNLLGYSSFLPKNCDSYRFDKLGIKLKSYRKKGNYILITGQIPWDTQVQYINYNKWLNNIFRKIKDITDIPILFRYHPLYLKKNIYNLKLNIPNFVEIDINDNIYDTFKDTFCLVSYNSNSLVEAVIEGIPIFPMNKMSLVYDLGYQDLNKIEEPYIPSNEERQQVLNNLSYMQWNLKEIESGEIFRYLENNYLQKL